MGTNKDYESMSSHELKLELAAIIFPDANIEVADDGQIFMDETPFDRTEWDLPRAVAIAILERLEALNGK